MVLIIVLKSLTREARIHYHEQDLARFKGVRDIKSRITSIFLAIILASIPYLPSLADSTGTITISMIGANELSITLSPTNWNLGEVASDMEYETSPPIEWCTLTNTSNVAINTFIVCEDAKWVEQPGSYEWTLSSDGTNSENTFGLWFRISGDNTRGPYGDGYVPITKTESEFWPYPDKGSSIEAGSHKQFGLRLLTPSSFDADKQMQTTITISAVAA